MYGLGSLTSSFVTPSQFLCCLCEESALASLVHIHSSYHHTGKKTVQEIMKQFVVYRERKWKFSAFFSIH